MKRRGFTLVELMVVLVILGILATVSIPLFATRREHIYDSQVETVLLQLRAAQRSYRLETGTFYASTGSSDQEHIFNIEDKLKVDLYSESDRPWNYRAIGSAVSGCIWATRNGDDSRNRAICVCGDGSVVNSDCSMSCGSC